MKILGRLDTFQRLERQYAQDLIQKIRALPSGPIVDLDSQAEFVPVRELEWTLTHNRRVLLTGAPGRGKTTALMHLALARARALKVGQQDVLIPILLSARGLPPSFSPDRDLVQALVSANLPLELLQRALSTQRAIFLIDDLDALEPEASKALLKKFAHMPVIATAEGSHHDLFVLPLPPWRDQDIEKFARLRMGVQSGEFVAALKSSGAPRALTSNPMTLVMLAQLFHSRPTEPLPPQRTALFERYVTDALGSDQETARMLEGVALAIQRGRRAPDEFIQKSRGFLHPMPGRMCDFVHVLWRAYFAARAARLGGDLTALNPHLSDPAWRETILFYAGLGDATELVAALQREDVLLAGFAAAHAKDLRADLRDSITQALLERAWNGEMHAATALGEMRSDRAVDALAARLKDPDAAVRARAAEILGWLQMDRALEYLLPQMRDINADTRDRVIQALGQSFSNRVIEPLLVALRGDPRVGFVDTRLRIAAAKALGQVGSDKAVPALIVDLQTGEPEIRPFAAEALKRIQSPFMIKPLEGILPDIDEGLREHIVDVLASLNGRRK